VRATFLIDPTGIVRLLTYYPMATGRNLEELVRALAALQETDASGLSTPAGWQPGDEAILPPPLTVAEADARTEAGATAWYYQAKAKQTPAGQARARDR
jgi:peroxiredoxin (alkyl hydroperoxide reductase subunit C)